jgi:uncharacterized membrane protein
VPCNRIFIFFGVFNFIFICKHLYKILTNINWEIEMSKKLISKAVVASALFGAVALMGHTADANKKMGHMMGEKCYGIAKAGHNDCKGSGHSCKGASEKDSDGKDFIMTKKGNCARIVGGSTDPK